MKKVFFINLAMCVLSFIPLKIYSQNNSTSRPSSSDSSENEISTLPVTNFKLAWQSTNFDNFDKGTIEILAHVYPWNNFGISAGMGYDLLSEGVDFQVGPSYAYRVNKYIQFGADLDFKLMCYSYATYKFNKYGAAIYDKQKDKVSWGLGLTPHCTIIIGKVTPFIGIPIYYHEIYDKVHIGLTLGVGYLF